MIQTIIQNLASQLGIEPSMVEKAIGIMLNFVQNNADSEAVSSLFAQFPEASTLASAAEESQGRGGLLSMGASLLGGLGSTGDAMAQLGRLKDLGLDMDQIGTIGETLFTEARNVAGDEVIDNIVDQIPALKQIMG